MVTWWIHLSWSHAAIVTLLPAIAVGYVLTDSSEDPRAWRLVRRVRGRWMARRARRLRREVLPDPWAGGIVRSPRFYTPHWTASVGRAYRAMAAERRGA